MSESQSGEFLVKQGSFIYTLLRNKFETPRKIYCIKITVHFDFIPHSFNLAGTCHFDLKKNLQRQKILINNNSFSKLGHQK